MRKSQRLSHADGKNGLPRGELAYEQLRRSIESRELKPGDRMLEADIAVRLGLSRTPVRDALKRLEADGLVEAAPRRGLLVAKLDHTQMSDLYAVQEVLGGLAARLAAQHAMPGEVAALRDSLHRQSRTAQKDIPELIKLNRGFHDTIYQASRNRYLVSALRTLESALALVPETPYLAPTRPVTALQQHTDIVNAIERGDEKAAEELQRGHIRSAAYIRQMMLSGSSHEALSEGPPEVRAGEEGALRRRRALRMAAGSAAGAATAKSTRARKG